MAMHFFKPSDLNTIPCTVNNKTAGGSAFAVTEAGEQVYISPKIVDAVKAEIGDHLTSYCIDNHRDGAEGQYSARWRAVRVDMVERFVPAAPKPPVEAPESTFDDLLRQDRAWTSSQMAKALNVDTLTASNWLQSRHAAGEIAAMKLYKSGEQERASKVYYARDIDLLEELVDEVVLN